MRVGGCVFFSKYSVPSIFEHLKSTSNISWDNCTKFFSFDFLFILSRFFEILWTTILQKLYVPLPSLREHYKKYTEFYEIESPYKR